MCRLQFSISHVCSLALFHCCLLSLLGCWLYFPSLHGWVELSNLVDVKPYCLKTFVWDVLWFLRILSIGYTTSPRCWLLLQRSLPIYTTLFLITGDFEGVWERVRIGTTVVQGFRSMEVILFCYCSAGQKECFFFSSCPFLTLHIKIVRKKWFFCNDVCAWICY